MLKSSFIHIPGVGKTTEEFLWRAGVRSWECFLERYSEIELPCNKKDYMRGFLERSNEEYINGNHVFFSERLPHSEHWRAYPDFSDVCFLDIETTGLSYYSDITLIGLYDGSESRFFVKGKNLDEFREEIGKYKTIVTFNGLCFDLPFIQRRFPEIGFNQFHIDLRYLMRRLGHRGGLKRIEGEIGLVRDESVREIDGLMAVRLWRRYERGDRGALKLLIEYNKADIENLKKMMEFAFERVKRDRLGLVANC